MVCTVSLPLASGVTLDGLAVGVAVTPNGPAPALNADGEVGFTDSLGDAFWTPGGTSNAASVLCFDISPTFSGNVTLGSMNFRLPAGAAGGQSYSAAITGGSGSLAESDVTLAAGGAATVTVAGASLQFVSPNRGMQGDTLATVAIAGLNSNFAQGTTVANFGAGVTVNSLTVTGPTAATANLTIAANATPGARSVTMTTGGEVASLTGAFTVLTPAPSCDVNGDNSPTVADVQKIINEALGVDGGADDLNGDGAVTVTDVQIVLNYVLELGCTGS